MRALTWQQLLASLAGALLCTAPVSAQVETDVEQRRIREVRIEVGPIYSEEEAEESSWASFTNKYHISTKESVIRTALLFKEGEVLDQQLLDATARSLRRFKFVNKADLVVIPVDEQTVDVEVHTKEAWTLEPGVNIKGGGGLSTVTLHVIDFNLMGYGKKAYVEGKHESDVGNTYKFGYSDYQLFGSRWIGNTTYQTGPLVESFFIQSRLPLFSPDSKWSYGGSAFIMDQTVRLFEDGEESSRFQNEQAQASLFLKRSYGPRFKKTKLSYGLKYLEKDYSSLGEETTTPPPPDQANVTPSFGISKQNIGWAKTAFVNKMGRTEDYTSGLSYGGNAGWGIPVGDSPELYKARLFLVENVMLKEHNFLRLSAVADSEVVRNTFLSLSAKYYRRFSKHTLAVRYMTKLGYELDSSRQFQLGADSGLRGYPARAFTGEKLMLLNIEDRQFWGTRRIGAEFELGTIVFVDAGNVWKDGDDVDLGDLNWSAGVGLRIGLENMPSSPILRIDYGWAVAGGSGSEVTVGMEQHF
jgi:hypothetical protein